MEPEELQRLIDGGETLDVEFKGESRTPLNDHDLVEAVVCLANRSGTGPGVLLIGVENNGSVTRDAVRIAQKPEVEIRGTLHRMVEAGLVEERGRKKGHTWHLSAAAYRIMGDKAAYVRQKGFETLQHEQMVLQYVEANGRITRRETANLCKINSHKARDLLGRLVLRGELVLRGYKRGAFYERAQRNMEGSKTAPKKSKN